jgi:hypothetical protein
MGNKKNETDLHSVSRGMPKTTTMLVFIGCRADGLSGRFLLLLGCGVRSMMAVRYHYNRESLMTLRQLSKFLSEIDLDKPLFRIVNGSQAADLNAFRSKLVKLNVIPFFIREKAVLMNSPLAQSVTDVVNFDPPQLVGIFSVAEAIRLGAKALREAISAIVPDGDEQTIVIKLPPAQDLDDVITFLSSLQKALSSNVINDEIKGRVEVKSWQPGSLWLDIGLGSVAAVVLVGSMAWAAAVIYKKWNEARIIRKFVDGLEIKNQTLDTLGTAVEESVALLVESEARNLLAHNFQKQDNHEQVERLKMGIKELANLIDKGAEIHPSLTAPENVQNLFPDFTKLGVIESKQKLITAEVNTPGGQQNPEEKPKTGI